MPEDLVYAFDVTLEEAQNYEVVYCDCWSSYEDAAALAIVRRGGVLYAVEGGSSPFGSSYDWDPQPVSEDESLELMIDFEEMMDSL